MFEKFFNRLSNEERSRLQPSGTSIKGIADITLKPLGQITLDVSLKEGLKERTRSLTFVARTMCILHGCICWPWHCQVPNRERDCDPSTLSGSLPDRRREFQ
ncbi:hypothetical protein Hanom_Chr05g00456491 [Helianthus anomalus]